MAELKNRSTYGGMELFGGFKHSTGESKPECYQWLPPVMGLGWFSSSFFIIFHTSHVFCDVRVLLYNVKKLFKNINTGNAD